jgi:hypothetical protein
MAGPRKPTHLRRSKLSRRMQLIAAVLSAVFVLYRIAAVFVHRGPGSH